MSKKPTAKAAAAEPMMSPAHLDDQPAPTKKPTDAPVWRDERQDPPPPPAIPRATAVQRLVDAGESIERAVQYVDLFHEYRTSTLNIRRYGVVAYDPRTYNAMENPYLGRRDRARDALNKMRDIEAPWLWKELAE